MTKFVLTYTTIFVVSVGLSVALPLPYSLIGYFGIGVVVGLIGVDK